MRILVGKVFGIGNAVMCVPLLRALRAFDPDKLDLLVGTTPDDAGALEVFRQLMTHFGIVNTINLNHATEKYDVAIMSIPFDGRWQNGVHFFADRVIDGRPRPEPLSGGLLSWKKHEVEYQMENAETLGWSGDIPPCSFINEYAFTRERTYYLGLGYKKDAAGFWKKKHWGNENYIELVKRILGDDPRNHVVTTGDALDLQLSIGPIFKAVNDKRFIYEPSNLRASLKVVADCEFYVGNDTGMGHVSAARNRKVVTIHNLENSIVKSHPWTDKKNRIELDGSKEPVSVDAVFQALKELR